MKKFYKCEGCDTIVGVVNACDDDNVCFEGKLKELVANTSDGAGEKHVPVVEVEGDKVIVKVGEVEHPMIKQHFIQWIYLETEDGGQMKKLEPGEKPVATFLLNGGKPVAAYEYCNLHGLWKTEL